MQHYFSPDLSTLREVPEATRQQVLGLTPPAVQPASDLLPDLQIVEQLLHMIRFARSAAEARVGA